MDYTISPLKLEAFKQYCIDQEKSEATIQKYVYNLKNFSRYLKDRAFSKANLIAYRAEQRNHYKAKTVNGRICAINAYLTFINRQELKLKLLSIQHQVFADVHREMTKRDYKRLVEAAKTLPHSRLYYLIQTLGATGIRVSELRFITVAAVRRGIVDISMKGKERTIIIPRALCALLKKYIAEQKIKKGPLFITRSGRPVDRSNVHHALKKLCTKAKVDPQKVFPHNFRHLFARCFYAVHKDIGRLADLLGHSSIETTRIYIAVSSQRFDKIFLKMKMIDQSAQGL